MTAGASCHMHGVAGKAHAFRRQNLVSFSVLQNTVLVDTGAMSKSVRTDNRLMRRYRFVADFGDKSGRSGDILGNNIGIQPFKEFLS